MSNRSLPGLPARAGIGLKARHYREILQQTPDLGWLEVHPENYMGAGGPPHHYLGLIRRDYPLSLHGVGLSLGSDAPADAGHLQRLKALVARYQPAQVSEHLAWASHGGVFLNDLLPLPLTRETLDIACSNIQRVQDALGRQILLENPSTYLRFSDDEYPEEVFLVELACRSGCGLLVDVNNVYVSACNHGLDPAAYLAAIPATLVGEIHLAGHSVEDIDGQTLRIDDHGDRVADAVWSLYEGFIQRVGSRPTLIEWDTRVPALQTLLAEAARAQRLLDRSEAERHATV